MSARRIPRELGVILVCNGARCNEELRTANVRFDANRHYAKSIGWIRGGRPSTRTHRSTKKHDYCPMCAPAERAAIKAWRDAKEERRKKRDANRAARKERDDQRKRDAAQKVAASA